MNFNEASDLAQQGKRIQRQGWADVAVGAGERGSMWITMQNDPEDDGDTPPHAVLVIERNGQPQRIVHYARSLTDLGATDWQEVAG
jgi:hypothetical protein